MPVQTPSRRPSSAARTVAPRLALAAALSLAACAPDQPILEPGAGAAAAAGPLQGTLYGAAVRLGDGIARSYVTLDGGAAVEVGVALSEAALRGLPSGSGHSDGSHQHYNQFLLRMHPQNPTPYQFMELNWNPDGHEPEGVYTVPHFDFHFYTISVAERDAIVPTDPQWADKANHAPAPEYLPANYAPAAPPIPGIALADIAVPRMGVHWVDVTSPELNGGAFTETFIYGTWDGRAIFAEPMITKAFLESKPSYQRTLPIPQQGYAPGSYRIYWSQSAREYRVALTDLPAQP